MKAKTSADKEATAVETKAVVASEVGAGAGASWAETETAETAIIMTIIIAKSFIIFIASMKDLCNSILNEDLGEKGIVRDDSGRQKGYGLGVL
ncbi:hypothetical protein L2E82_04976 [Cichorium intybus]|uniref:Uncharacterized protein n=1 Tax=Cichorium intybus TaxID=13427 RepID=A0ACB9H685_CICIN|nr:hypothetical protein L2E82_04976 [Cichorium intybus]